MVPRQTDREIVYPGIVFSRHGTDHAVFYELRPSELAQVIACAQTH